MKPESVLKLQNKLGIELFDIKQRKSFNVWNKYYTFETNAENEITGLDLSELIIEDFNFLEEFRKIAYLNLSSCKIRNLSFLKKTKSIIVLNISNNLIEDLAPIIDLEYLIELDVTQNHIANFDILKELKHLEILKFGKNPCLDISFLKDIKNLKSLDISYVSSYNYKPNFNFLLHFSHLEELTLMFNDLEDISFLKNLENLKRLNLTHNKVLDISVLSELKSLEKLWLQDNKINDVSPLRSLIKLNYLDISINQIVDISHLKDLSLLTRLKINNNNVSDITDILKLDNLKKVDLQGNKKIEIDFAPTIVEAGWEAIKQYAEDSKEKVPFKNIKVLLLGNSNMGKTSLLRYFARSVLLTDSQTTHGIEYKQLKLNNIDFHFWDFGGQEYFHATHKLFFSPNALNIVLWGKDIARNNDKVENQFYDLNYWLRTVEQLNLKSVKEEVIILENKIDLNNPPNTVSSLNQFELASKFQTLNLNYSSISLLTSQRIESFKELFFELAETIISKFNYPSFYDVFWKRIQEMNKDFVIIDEINNRPHKDNVTAAMKVFHNMGMLLYFSELIPDKIFCKPQVLLDLLYEKVLSKEKKDRLTKAEIEKSINANSLQLSIEDVILLLKKFNLVFEIAEEKNTYFIPQYLKDKSPYIIDFQEQIFNRCNIKIIADNYLMSIAMLKIFSKYGNYVSREQKEYRFWRNGIIIKKDDSILMIQFIRETQTIELFPDKENKNIELQKEIVDFILDLPEDISSPKRNFDNHRSKRWIDVMDENDVDYSPHFSERIQEYEGYLQEFEARNWDNRYRWESNFFNVQVSIDGEFFIEWKELKKNEDLSEINFINENGQNKKNKDIEYCHLIDKKILMDKEKKADNSVIYNFNAPVNAGIIGSENKIETQNVNPIKEEKEHLKIGLSEVEKKAVKSWKNRSNFIFAISLLLTASIISIYVNENTFIMNNDDWDKFKDGEWFKWIGLVLAFIWNALIGKMWYERNFDPSKENSFIDLHRKKKIN
ncbi:leucine-rich repeat domain-containing protein [Flavobacterium sp. 102]|uniref:leucine-rich repeat domain-containing protein n=1 Tax=Flavobacterium sp. 102 TaxID=2135623 RepID=UPI0013142553|nr:leucine-rich repeat domain-containing protein [Flavobacterium sp. 102]